MAQRIKGQECELLMTVKGQPQLTTTDIRSFEIGFQFDIMREGYIGETTQRRDEIYNGFRGRMEMHVENDDFLQIINAIADRSRRRAAAIKINLKVTLNFPNGDRPRVCLNDVYFGEMPLGFGGRGDYGTFSLDFEGSEFAILN
jgi:hypothetical protein